MAINIFDVNPEGVSKRQDDYIGSARGGMQLNGRPMSLATWRFTTGDRAVADTIARAYGGVVEEWETTTDEKLQVITDVDSVDIILEKVVTSMVLWGKKGKIRECDGIVQKADEAGACAGCVCPSALPDKKKAAKLGTGCEPSVGVFFRLDHPDLVDEGVFKMWSGGWTWAKDVQDVERKHDDLGGVPVHAKLMKRKVEFTAGDGTEVKYVTPDIRIGTAVEGASIEEPF